MSLAPTTEADCWPRPLIAILTIGLAVRLVLWAGAAGVEPRIEDEREYLSLASRLVAYGEYGYRTDTPTSLRPPLYPAFIAAVYRIVGTESLQAVRLVQALLSLVTCVLLFRLGRLAYSARAGIWAAGILAFYPTFLGYNNLILTEVVFTLWAVAGVLAIVTALRRDNIPLLAAAGVSVALGALTRSILFPFAPVLCGFLIAAWRGSLARRALAASVFAFSFTGVIAPWADRNSRLEHTFVPIDCMGGRNFMMGNYEYTPMYRSWDAISLKGERAWIAVLYARHERDWGDPTQGQIDKRAMAEAISYIRQNPLLTLRRDLVKFADFWGLEREIVAGAANGFFGQIPTAVVGAIGLAVCGTYVLVLFSGVFGASLRPPTDTRTHILFLLVITFVCGVHSVVFAHSRYHLPVMPFVMLYAAAAITGPGVWADRRRLSFWIATGICLLIAAGWLWNAIAGDWDKVQGAFNFTA
jgi:4-amino-4-deoxy-L-arabinose transferase-like glycosyltransferase